MTNKAFMWLGLPRRVLAAPGPGNLLFVNRFIVRHDLEMMRYFISHGYRYISGYTSISSLFFQNGLSFQLLNSII